jgi:hypothetical protein
MTLRQPSAKPGEDPQTPSAVHATHSDDDERAPREGLHTAPLQRSRWERVQGYGDISFTI